MPRIRQAALMRMIHSRRNSRLRTRRSRKAYTRARSSVTTACRYRLCRLRRNPLVSFRRRFRPRSTVLPLRARTMTAHSPYVFRGRRSVLAAHDLAILLPQLPGLHDRFPELALALAGLVAEQVLLAG